MPIASQDTQPGGTAIDSPRRLTSGTWRNWRLYGPEDPLICLVPAIYLIAAYIALALAGSRIPEPGWLLLNSLFYVQVVFFVMIGELAVRLAIARPQSPIRFAVRHMTDPAYVRNLAASALVILALSFFMTVFSALKSSIPLFNAFAWDGTFIDLDRAIHGDDAWRILQPTLGHPLITSFLSSAYHFWFVLIYLGPVYFAIFHQDRAMRTRFFLGYFLSWIVCGTVLATAFASVGPCFAEPLLGNPRFADQMAYLHAVDEQYPLFVIEIQQQILYWYHNADNGLGRGITAMPSMHVSLAFLYYLVMRRIDRRLGWIFGAFCAAILLGSVHLAYHYAVDGYVAIVVTGVVWAVTAPLARCILGRENRSTLLQDGNQ